MKRSLQFIKIIIPVVGLMEKRRILENQNEKIGCSRGGYSLFISFLLMRFFPISHVF